MAHVREHRERNFLQLWVSCAPVEVSELVIGGAAKDLGIAVLELLVQLAKGSDLGRADEGEVLRVEKDHLPLALVLVQGYLLEVVLRLVSVDVVQVATGQGGEVELWELFADSQNRHSLQLL